jgi:AraC family transcriptional regulator
VNVQIVTFPGTRVAAIEHWGPPSLEHDTVRKLVAWKLEQQLSDPARYRSYGVHYTDPRTTPASEHQVEFCLSIEREVGPNSLGIVAKSIPTNRCALARDIGPATTTRRRSTYMKYGCRGAGRRRARSRFSSTTSTSAPASAPKT